MPGKSRKSKSTPNVDRPTLDYLSYRGPHRVAVGRLDPSGLPGLVVAPASGRDLPLVAIGHGWLQPVARYTETMRFLASWGIATVAPDTERGFLPSHGALARDLRTALDIMVGGRVAGGRVRSDGGRTGVLGHSIGGGAAVLAAAAEPAIKAVMTVTAADTRPSAVGAATKVKVPGLHLVGGDDDMAGSGESSDGAAIAAAWAGDSQLRVIKGVGHYGLPEGKHWSTAIVGSSGVKKAQQATRLMAAAFFLRHLADQDQLADELEGKIAGTSPEDLEKVRETTA